MSLIKILDRGEKTAEKFCSFSLCTLRSQQQSLCLFMTCNPGSLVQQFIANAFQYYEQYYEAGLAAGWLSGISPPSWQRRCLQLWAEHSSPQSPLTSTCSCQTWQHRTEQHRVEHLLLRRAGQNTRKLNTAGGAADCDCNDTRKCQPMDSGLFVQHKCSEPVYSNKRQTWKTRKNTQTFFNLRVFPAFFSRKFRKIPTQLRLVFGITCLALVGGVLFESKARPTLGLG